MKLLVIVLIYLALAVAYSLVTPIGRGADEWAHYWYAQFIADNGRLPASPAEREAAGYKSDWPPLYHLAAAALTGWIETEGPPTFKYRADSLRRQLIPAQGPEAIVHTEDELFPWRQEILVWHLGRFLSIAFSVGTLLVTYFIALEVFSGFRGAGEQGDAPFATRNSQFAIRNSHFLVLAAVAVLAFNPRFLFTGMLFNYDSLTLLLASLFLWLAIRVTKGYHARWGFWGLGALAGLALVTKYLAALLPLVILYVAWVRAVGEQGRNQQVTGDRLQVTHRKGAGAQVTQPSKLITKNSALKTDHSKLITQNFSGAIRNLQFLIRPLAQALLAYLLIAGWWFAYLIVTFNEIDTYGPLLGTLAPLIRGDGSDRTVETLFAWLSGGQAPPPAYIEPQSYSVWQIIGSFFTTFWGNPVVQPYPLVWFIAAMTLVMVLAFIGLTFQLRIKNYELQTSDSPLITYRSSLIILILTCLLPAPFMLARLFGARDALEAVQGRHILFLAGPAVAILLVLGLSHLTCHPSRVTHHSSLVTRHASRITFYVVLALLLTGSLAQLIFMATAYPPPAPVRTTPIAVRSSQFAIRLPGGAQLIGYSLFPAKRPYALQVDLSWQGGQTFAPEDYHLELALLDQAGEAVSGWRSYQTQARYPTRAWEPGDFVRDSGWLPLTGLPAGDYTVRWRLLGDDGPLFEWQDLDQWTIVNHQSTILNRMTVWRDGQPVSHPSTFKERETAQLTNYDLRLTNYELTGPNGDIYPPASAGLGWASFIVEPHWPPGDYRLGETVALRVAGNQRRFQLPGSIEHPLAVNFEGKIKLLGYDLPTRRVEPGGGLPLTLYWQGLEWLGEEFVIFSRLLDNQGFAWGGYDRLAKENYSTLLWAPGEIIVDGFAVPVEAGAPDGVYTLSLGWYRRVGDQAESLPILDPVTGEPTGQTAVTIGPLKVGGPPPGATVESAQPQNVTDIFFDGQIKLLGYDVRMDESANLRMDGSATNQLTNQPAIQPANQPAIQPTNQPANQPTNSMNSMNLTFYWQALRQPDADYTVFVHVRDEAGSVIAQKDQPPLAGAYPTGLWDAGEIISDEVRVPLDGVPPGRYQLVAGLYDPVSGQRLPVEGLTDGAVLLETIEVYD